MRILISILAIILLSNSAQAAFSLSRNLSKTDRQIALEVLGLGSSSKFLSNPYPLGGYSGVELGVQTEVISAGDISRIGDKTGGSKDLAYQLITLGKGLYNDLDVFLQFGPVLSSEKISNYGLQLKWCFVEGKHVPATLSLYVHSSNTNFSNQLITQTAGFDLIAGFNVERTAIYFGTGQVRSIGTFIGGADGVTSSSQSEDEDIRETHSFLGFSYDVDPYFISAQIDRHYQSVLSFKIGTRF